MTAPQQLRAGAVAVVLSLLTLAVFLPAAGFGFVNYDDPGYVTANPLVRKGLVAVGAAWTTPVEGNYHPLTVLSHQLDVSLFGLDAGGHHATSAFLHLVNVLLLFVLSRRLLGHVGAAALVAALFAVHPLNVQSVAWVAERKNVLSTLFWLAGLVAWSRWLEGGRRAYAAAFVCCALGLLAKPMVVGFPATQLALMIGVGKRLPRLRELAPLLPFVGLALAGGLATLWAQHALGAMQDTAAYPLDERLAGAIVSYAWYLWKTVWPAGLAVFYPQYVGGFSAAAIAVSALLLAGISATAWMARLRAPWLFAGWFWYVATLAPVSGLIQVGAQAHADRYAYVPLIGVFLAAGAGLAAMRTRWSGAAWGLGATVVVGLAFAGAGELRHWRNSLTLFSRAAEVTPANGITHGNLGMAYIERRDPASALPWFRSAVEADPDLASSWSNLANALAMTGRHDEAIRHYREALKRSAGDAALHFNFAMTLERSGRVGEAVGEYREAVASTNDPQMRARATSRIRALEGDGRLAPSEGH